MNAAELLVGGRPEAIALVDNDREIDYADLRALCRRSAGAWLALGVRPGERVVIALPDGIDWAIAFIGLMWAGGQPIIVNPRTSAEQFHGLIDDSGAATLLLEDAVAATHGAGAIALSNWQRRLAACQHMPEPFSAEPDWPAFMLYSSGTTGRPKGVVHAHRAICEAHVFARNLLGADATDRFYSTSKLFFAYPLANALFAGLRLGATVILDFAWPEPGRVAEIVARHRPTLFFSVPTLLRRLLEAGVSLGPLRASVSAGEACPPALAQAWMAHTGAELINGYGTTETLCLMLYRTPSMGAACATPLTRVTEEASTDCGNETLRLWFDHPAVALGYSRTVTHDSARFGAFGFSPGDLFRKADDAEGWLFAGRTDQLVKVFGRWVDILAVEDVLQQVLKGHLGELCVVPRRGKDDSEPVCLHLFIVPAASGDTAELSRDATHAIEALPPYQRPREIHLVAAFPRTDTGKLKRAELASQVS
ncbi:class I adenylate-forming enzyme family protein [Azoarcus taiwanensis]|uniref:AMP-binding protein n=1 Tax=Azoarcus taiwanensis TaxID=666964 RepID=A0A972FA83_9RHOO|nr:AMP-binding protein [Azoarcus taiwanensis]NMG01442.1 AMP-binding protein [Azoarcus taiwanensis]